MKEIVANLIKCAIDTFNFF